jgi:hypothetical protein
VREAGIQASRTVKFSCCPLARPVPDPEDPHRDAVLALAVLPSGGPPDLAQVVLALSGGVLAVVVLWQAYQTAQAQMLERTA